MRGRRGAAVVQLASLLLVPLLYVPSRSKYVRPLQLKAPQSMRLRTSIPALHASGSELDHELPECAVLVWIPSAMLPAAVVEAGLTSALTGSANGRRVQDERRLWSIGYDQTGIALSTPPDDAL